MFGTTAVGCLGDKETLKKPAWLAKIGNKHQTSNNLK